MWFVNILSADYISVNFVHKLDQKYRDFEVGFLLIYLICQKATCTTTFQAFLFSVVYGICMCTLLLPHFLLILFEVIVISFYSLFVYYTNWCKVLFLFTFWFACFCCFGFVYWLGRAVFLAWKWLAVFFMFCSYAFVDPDGCCYVLMVCIEADSFLLLYFIRGDVDNFISLNFRLFSLVFGYQPHLIFQQSGNSNIPLMRIYFKEYIGDIFVDVIFDGFDTPRMMGHEISKFKYFIFEEEIIFAIFFTLINPLFDGFFFHWFFNERK